MNYFRGTFYETQEEVIEASIKYNLSRISPISLYELMMHITQELNLNIIDLGRTHIRNCEFEEIVHEARNFIIQKCCEINGENIKKGI